MSRSRLPWYHSADWTVLWVYTLRGILQVRAGVKVPHYLHLDPETTGFGVYLGNKLVSWVQDRSTALSVGEHYALEQMRIK